MSAPLRRRSIIGSAIPDSGSASNTIARTRGIVCMYGVSASRGRRSLLPLPLALGRCFVSLALAHRRSFVSLALPLGRRFVPLALPVVCCLVSLTVPAAPPFVEACLH
jgi:hypothetical protein